MVDDKYIGLALAVASSAAMGSSYIITKKGLNDAAERDGGYVAASDDYAYLRNPTWWLGMGALVLGEAANFAAYMFAPAILVTPLGALTVIVGAVLASIFLKEELGHLGRIGSLLCLLGATIIVLHAPEDKEIETVDEVLHYAIQPGFLMFCFTSLVFCLIMIYHVVPRHGKKNPMVYISICSISGAVSVMAVKGFGIAVKLTFSGKNQFTHPSTYVFAIVMILCIVVQLNYFNKALDTFSTNVVNPMYYVGFSTSVIVASLILFQGFNTDNTTNSISLILGFIVTFLGVHLLNLSRHPEPPTSVLPSSVPFEGGLLSPRITGRTSADGWPSSPTSGVSHHHRHSRSLEGLVGHRRGGSRYQVQDPTVFALGEEDEGEGVPLKRLNDDSDDDELEADERTRLRRHMNGDMNGGTSSPSKNVRL